MTFRRATGVLWLLTAAAALVFLACSQDAGTPPTPGVFPEGAIRGRVKVGPLCPVEPCPTPAVNPYEGVEVVLRGEPETRRLRVDENGEFIGTVFSGEYELTVEPCEWLGCSAVLPLQVNIEPAEMEVVEVDIDTGIR